MDNDHGTSVTSRKRSRPQPQADLADLLAAVPTVSYAGAGTRRRAVVFLLLYNDPAPTILGIQKTDSQGYPWRGQIALPGGHVEESDPSPLEAAYREVFEEVNLPREAITFVGSLGHFATIHDLDIEVMAGIWDGSGNPTHDPSEISRLVHIPIEALARIHHRERYGGHIPDVMTLRYTVSDAAGDYTIWGVTARVIHHLLEHLPEPPEDT